MREEAADASGGPAVKKTDHLTEYYGKYNEEKRLLHRYGQIEYRTTMKYVEECIGDRQGLRILDVGCATGRYLIPLAEKGHELTGVDYVNYNLGILRQKAERLGLSVTAKQGDARDLSKYPEDHYDIVLFLGPMYHLFTEEDKVRALTEAKRVLKPGGFLFAGYIMNEFGVIRFGIMDGNIADSVSQGKLDRDFHIRNTEEDLFSFDTPEDIDRYRRKAGLRRVKILSQDGPTNYMRQAVEALSDEAYELYYAYHLSTCERPDLLGAGCHTLDILTKD
ncbi:MAG: methyltransferase domain-containing protein [Lachnospiraceae bacterium]|nr:methyltransferase domain-containing protein [Lachnospiraceae bacterium]